MNDIEYQIECITRDLATYLVRDFSFDVTQALRAGNNFLLPYKLPVRIRDTTRIRYEPLHLHVQVVFFPEA